jgi:enterochelin esterase-like enzyme
VFGKLATQSLYTHNQPVADGLAALIEAPAESAARIYMDWCTRELADPGEGMDLRRDNARLAALLQAAGHGVTAHEVPAGPGWGTWRARTRLILKTLFPAPQ